MDSQIQQILDQATTPQGATSQPESGDPLHAILQSAGITPQTPADVSSAEQQIGNKNYQNLCQKFAEEQVYGHSGIYSNAVSAWNDYIKQGKASGGLQNAKPGNLIYFSPNSGNGNNGHVGIYEGDNKFVSATGTGVKSYDLNDWQKITGQSILGSVAP